MCRPGSEGCRDGKNVLLVTRMSILGITLPRIQNKTQDFVQLQKSISHLKSCRQRCSQRPRHHRQRGSKDNVLSLEKDFMFT